MNRVKSLSKSGNTRKDQAVASLPQTNKDVSSASSLPVANDMDDVFEQQQEAKAVDMGRRVVEKESLSYNPTVDYDKQPSSFTSSYSFNGQEESVLASGAVDRERFESNSSYGGSTSQKIYSSYSQNSVDTEEKVQKVSPPRRKGSREEKSEKLGNWLKKDGIGSDPSANSRQQNTGSYNANNTGLRQHEPDPPSDGNINAILEVTICSILCYFCLFGLF